MTDSTTKTDSTRTATLRCAFCLKLNRVDVGRADDRPKCGECGKPFLLDRPVKISGEDLERVVAESDVPVLIDFYADWCGPCKMIAPIIDEIAEEYGDRIKVTKMDIDSNMMTPQQYSIRGIPTLMIFKDGDVEATKVGALSKSQLTAFIDSNL